MKSVKHADASASVYMQMTSMQMKIYEAMEKKRREQALLKSGSLEYILIFNRLNFCRTWSQSRKNASVKIFNSVFDDDEPPKGQEGFQSTALSVRTMTEATSALSLQDSPMALLHRVQCSHCDKSFLEWRDGCFDEAEQNLLEPNTNLI